MVLFFFQLLTMLSLQAYHTVINRIKISNVNWHLTQQVYRQTQLQHKIENTVPDIAKKCIIPIISLYQLARKPIAWWQTNACVYSNKNKIYYVLEILGEDACAIFAKADQSYASYYRLTILFDHLLFRSTFAFPKQGTQRCQHSFREIKQGVQVHQKKNFRCAGKAC